MQQTGVLVLVATLVVLLSHSAESRRVDCTKFVFAPICRGVSAKRGNDDLTALHSHIRDTMTSQSSYGNGDDISELGGPRGFEAESGRQLPENLGPDPNHSVDDIFDAIQPGLADDRDITLKHILQKSYRNSARNKVSLAELLRRI